MAAFIEGYCRMSKGEYRGQPMLLRDWQRREIIDPLFAVGPDGLRRVRTGFVGMPRKNGKSSLAAALALYGLVADNEPGAEVYSVAGDRKQAGIVFREAREMVLASPALSKRITVFQHHLECPQNGGVYHVLSSDAKLQQGLNASFVIFDEVHVQPNDDLWVALQFSMATRRQPLMIGITTAGFGNDTLAWRLYDHGQRVEAGEIDDPSFYFRWWQPADFGADYRDPAVWAAANPALGDFLKPEALAADLAMGESEFRRYHLNQWTTVRDAWLPHGSWAACAAPREVTRREPVILGFDGAWTEDSTAIVGATVGPKPHLWVERVWEKPAGVDSWQTPSDEVTEAMLDASKRYQVTEIAADPHQWREQISKWRRELGLPVHEWPTNSVARMVPACSEFYRAVMEQRLTHDGDPRLARHIANAVIKEDRFGRRIVKDSSKRKIDLAVAAIIAYDRARARGRSVGAFAA